MDPYKVLKFAPTSEKNTKLLGENKIVFIVDRNSNKEDIKKAFESLFEVKVEKVNTLITRDGKKKAFIKLKPEYSAEDIAAKLSIV